MWAAYLLCQRQKRGSGAEMRCRSLSRYRYRIKACTLDRIGRKGSRSLSLLSPHVAGLYFRRRLGWSRISEPVSMAPVSFPRCCVVSWMWLSSPQGRKSKRPASPAAQLPTLGTVRPAPADKSRTRTCPSPPSTSTPAPPRLAFRLAYSRTNFSFLPPC